MKETHEKEIRKFAGETRRIYLHGSRRMAQRARVLLPRTVDWDYAVDYLEGWELGKAMDLGWTECVDRSYCDANTSVVLEREIDGDKVQLSSRKSLAEYVRVFESIDPEKYFRDYRHDKETFRKWLSEQYHVYVDFGDIPF